MIDKDKELHLLLKIDNLIIAKYSTNESWGIITEVTDYDVIFLDNEEQRGSLPKAYVLGRLKYGTFEIVPSHIQND